MVFETPTIESGNEKSEKEIKEFLAIQVALPKEQRSEDFRRHVEKKIKENEALESNADVEGAVERQQETFKRYLKGLGVTVEDLKDKTILDLGSGESDFIKECIDKNITENIYGLDIELPEEIEEKYHKYLIKGNFEDPLPVKNADYVISMGAVSTMVWGGEDFNTKKILRNAVGALNEKGEVRIYPIPKPAEGSELEGIRQSYERWQTLLQEFSKEENIIWELKPIDIRVSGKENDIWLEEALIIKKKARK